MKVEEVVDGVYRVDLGMVNCYLLDGKELTLVDTGTPGKDEAVLRAIAEIGRAPEDLRRILLTHLHADHAGSLARLKARTGAEVCMHSFTAERIATGVAVTEINRAPTVLSFLATTILKGAVPSQVEACGADEILQEGDQLPYAWGADVLYLPGHASGQIGFLIPRHGGVLILADAAVNFGGRLNYPIIVEDLSVTEDTLRRIGDLRFEVALFGHGKPIHSGAGEAFRRRWIGGSVS